MNATPETWRPIPSFEGYEVSDQGNVRSLDRIIQTVCGPRPARGRVLKPAATHRRGYLHVRLGGGPNTSRFVHQLVAEAFFGPRPVGMVVCHNDGDPTNNRPCNLRYDTQSGNMQDSIRHGTNFRANKTHCLRGHDLKYAYVRIDGSRQCRQCRRDIRAGLTKARTATNPHPS